MLKIAEIYIKLQKELSKFKGSSVSRPQIVLVENYGQQAEVFFENNPEKLWFKKIHEGIKILCLIPEEQDSALCIFIRTQCSIEEFKKIGGLNE